MFDRRISWLQEMPIAVYLEVLSLGRLHHYQVICQHVLYLIGWCNEPQDGLHKFWC
jgi:hypothetical protein